MAFRLLVFILSASGRTDGALQRHSCPPPNGRRQQRGRPSLSSERWTPWLRRVQRSSGGFIVTATKEDRPSRPRVLPEWVDICLSAAAAAAGLLCCSPESITTNGNNKAQTVRPSEPCCIRDVQRRPLGDFWSGRV